MSDTNIRTVRYTNLYVQALDDPKIKIPVVEASVDAVANGGASSGGASCVLSIPVGDNINATTKQSTGNIEKQLWVGRFVDVRLVEAARDGKQAESTIVLFRGCVTTIVRAESAIGARPEASIEVQVRHPADMLAYLFNAGALNVQSSNSDGYRLTNGVWTGPHTELVRICKDFATGSGKGDNGGFNIAAFASAIISKCCNMQDKVSSVANISQGFDLDKLVDVTQSPILRQFDTKAAQNTASYTFLVTQAEDMHKKLWEQTPWSVFTDAVAVFALGVVPNLQFRAEDKPEKFKYSTVKPALRLIRDAEHRIKQVYILSKESNTHKVLNNRFRTVGFAYGRSAQIGVDKIIPAHTALVTLGYDSEKGPVRRVYKTLDDFVKSPQSKASSSITVGAPVQILPLPTWAWKLGAVEERNKTQVTARQQLAIMLASTYAAETLQTLGSTTLTVPFRAMVSGKDESFRRLLGSVIEFDDYGDGRTGAVKYGYVSRVYYSISQDGHMTAGMQLSDVRTADENKAWGVSLSDESSNLIYMQNKSK